jgi:hypothetical protein
MHPLTEAVNKSYQNKHLIHSANQIVDESFTVSKSTSLNEWVGLLTLSRQSGGVAELEGPEEVGRLLEVRSNSDNFVY